MFQDHHASRNTGAFQLLSDCQNDVRRNGISVRSASKVELRCRFRSHAAGQSHLLHVGEKHAELDCRQQHNQQNRQNQQEFQRDTAIPVSGMRAAASSRVSAQLFVRGHDWQPVGPVYRR